MAVLDLNNPEMLFMNWFARLFKGSRPKRPCGHRRLTDGLAANCSVCRAESKALANKAKDDLAPEIEAFTDALKAALPGEARRAVCEITFQVVSGKFRFGFSFMEPKGYSPGGDVLLGPIMDFFRNTLNKGHGITKAEFVAERGPDHAWSVSLGQFSLSLSEH